MIKRTFIVLFIISLLYAVPSFSKGNPAFNGKWELIKEKSSDVGGGSFILKIQIEDSKITLTRRFGMGRGSGSGPEDILTVTTDGKPNKFKIDRRTFSPNSYMGTIMLVGEERIIKAEWLDEGNTLKLEESYPLWTSQGTTEVKTTHLYKLDPVKEEIVYTIERNTRPNSPASKYVFKPENKNNACYMKLEDDWDINGKLPPQAFLISLQGVVNSSSPQLYFIYGDKWDYKFTPGVYDFLKEKHNFTFTQLNTTQEAVDKFKDQIKGYVVWDKNIRTSLIVAFTVCGLESAVAITEDMIPMMEKAGIKMVEDFRGKFTGKSDLEIYTWAYDKYWKRCSRDYIVWMGGEHGTIMRPGVADFGIMKKAFFTDASTNPKDKEEYEFAKKVMSEQKTMSMVMGWHSYKKDHESTFTTLASSFALRVEGLHTLPNMSFTANVPATKGFKYKNNHNLVPGKQYIPEKKVYMTFIQSDCLGLGAWTEPGRGFIPYTWEVTMNWLWLAPTMLEYFYGQSTPNDYFIGALSGPGYMYPKAIPKKYLPEVFDKAKELMNQLDLNAFEIMDHSEERNADLPKDLVDSYYENMPNSIGFINGYGPAHTFTSKNGRPFLSFDYYVSQNRPDSEVVADLQELGRLNAQRPYFMVVHVREYSTIARMKAIFDKLGPEYELIPTDIFLKMAGNNPTFKDYFRK
jgi:hypothetical protein